MITASDVYYIRSKADTIEKKLEGVYREMFAKGFDGTDGAAQIAVDAVDRMMKDAKVLREALAALDAAARKGSAKK